MASIILHDIPGSSYTDFVGLDYRKASATRRFLVDGGSEKNKLAIIDDVRTALLTSSQNHHPNTEGSSSDNGFTGLLPLQSISLTKAGTTTGGNMMWIAEARYGYS
tara:strand:+ start:2130 stop:2447 length:318 start_codon:yes stop_codon:yes gene_type:complete